MKRMLLWLNVIFILCSSSPAQNSTDVPGIDTLASRVKLFGETLPQEKVYLHIDNTCYFVGDTIWYKGYVTRSDKGTLTDLSRILYVELLTPDGYLVERQQLEMTAQHTVLFSSPTPCTPDITNCAPIRVGC